MVVKLSRLQEEMADREAIRDCLYRYARGVDRCDEDMVRSAYWEDAFDDHCLFAGTREDLLAWLMPLLRAREATQHSIANILIRLQGGSADVESYFQGYHVLRTDGKVTANLQGGRYLDRMERRDDEWRIVWRRVVVDWFREYPEAGDWTQGPQGLTQIRPGTRYPSDDSYTALNLA